MMMKNPFSIISGNAALFHFEKSGISKMTNSLSVVPFSEEQIEIRTKSIDVKERVNM